MTARNTLLSPNPLQPKTIQSAEPLEFFEIASGGRKKVISVKMESSLVEELDRVWRSLGYISRSQFIREAIVYYMAVVRAVKNGNVCLCDCSKPGARRLEDVLLEDIDVDNVEEE